MILERAVNAKRNMVFGMINKIVAIICPFIVRTIFIIYLGVEYLGLNSLFSSILMVLSLTESGFSSAIVFSMYKPIAENDIDTINALLSFYKKVYRYVGIAILLIGLSLVNFLPYLIKGEYPSDVNIKVVFLVYLFNTVISYFLFAYRSSLITAYQREDLISKVNIAVSIIMYLCQIFALMFCENYYVYVIVMPLFTIINNIKTLMVTKKMFPNYEPHGHISRSQRNDIVEKVGGLLISKVCQVSRNSLDSIFISMFLGLATTAIYNNYYYVMNSVITLMSVIITSITAGVGNSVTMDTVEKNYNDMNKMNFIYLWIAGWCTICMFCLYQPFMKIWVGEELMFPIEVVGLICLYFYVLKMGDIRSVYVQATGLWWHNRYRSMAEAATNLFLNYFLGKYFGINGIIIATVISLLVINFGYGSQIIYKFYFKEQSVKKYYIQNLVYFSCMLINLSITYYVCSSVKFDGVVGLITKMLICTVLPNIVFYIMYKKTPVYGESTQWVLSKLKKNNQI